jgi:hypothetical protein
MLKALYAGMLALGLLLVSAVPVWARIEAKPFGVTKFTMQTTGPTVETPLGHGNYDFANEPETFTQAGGHPWALTTTVEFASEEFEFGGTNLIVPTRDPKDVVVSLPPGLLGDPMATPRCPLAVILGKQRCPSSTQVGVYRTRWSGGGEALGPIINVVPEAGQSAEFALEQETRINFVETGHLVRGPGGYGFTVVGNQIPQVEVVSVEQTFWGVPADPGHDAMRGLFCGVAQRNRPLECQEGSGGHAAGVSEVPFLTMPSDCSAGPVGATLRADSWQEPGHIGDNQQFTGYVEKQAEAPLPTVVGGTSNGFTGCDLLGFGVGTGIEVQPDTTLADEAVGLAVNLHVPLKEKPQSIAAPLLRSTVVTLPEGMSVSPGVVDGIEACEATGPKGINIEGPESEAVGLNGELKLAAGHCPDASIVGSAEAITPFLPEPVKGHVYLAKPECGGAGEHACTEQDALDGKLYKLYLEIGGEGALANEGIVFKVPFDTQANPATGQLTTKAEELVQAPYSEVRIHLNGGPRAPLDNPAVCGPAATTADFTPWSAPGEVQGQLVAGTPDALSESLFKVEGCSNPPPLNPAFVAGTVTTQAGQFSSFTMNLARNDREQYIKGIQLHTPPGLLAMLSSVPLCEAAAADSGTCPASSKIGTTRVASGAGSHPFEIEGVVYLTGPYCGPPQPGILLPPSDPGCAPFGLSIVTHAAAGPFDLGLVVVRARIDIDREDSTARVTLDETGPYAIPQIVFGVPLRLKRVTANIDRPGFMFNPTNCNALRVTAIVAGSENTAATMSSPFAAGGCKSLGFKPKFTVSTSGHTSRARGASLDAKVSYPSGSMGQDANIARVKVSLPKQLPSRLTTLQKACPSATFSLDPAACPPASVVGVARARTPLLPVGLSGPVYFVSHGGEAFPSLIVVLQGDGVRVDLMGTTFINKAGITSSTFKTVPDVPVGRFELYLPDGRYSALAANGDLCKESAKLIMPTEMTAQNGMRIRQRTKINVTGCPSGRKRTTRNRGRSGARP